MAGTQDMLGAVPPGDRLDSWKEIAGYLGRGVTTAQRWEQEEGLPVRRLPHAKRGSVYAYRHELDRWLEARSASVSDAPAPAQSPLPAVGSRQLTFRPWLAGGMLVTLGVVVLAALGIAWSADTRGSEPALASAPRGLATEPTPERHPSLSPDGESVVYTWRPGDRGQLFIKPARGGSPRALEIGASIPASFPLWSPRGDLISFLSRETEHTRGLYVVPASGGQSRKLSVIAGVGVCWAPDGRSIGFADRNAESEPFSIFTIELDTGVRNRLTAAPRGTFGDTHCAFSRDGRHLAFARYHMPAQSDLYVVPFPEAEERPARRMTTDFTGILGLAWTPDQRHIVFGSHVGLFRVPAWAMGPQQPELLAGKATSLTYPAFPSASGDTRTRLVFEQTARNMYLWRWRASPTPLAERIHMDPRQPHYPAVSPDGRRVAFSSSHSGSTEIWTAGIDGADTRQVSFQRNAIVLAPRWSADGRWLTYSAQFRGNQDIYVVRADGSESRRLTFEPSLEENPSWSRDGRWVYFKSDRSGLNQIWKVPSTGGQAVPVTRSEGSQALESSDGRLYFVRSAHAAGLWSMPASGGPEEFVVGGVREHRWDLVDGGCVYMDMLQLHKSFRTAVRRFDFRTRTTSVLLEMPRLADAITGFAASPDARTVVWPQTEGEQGDIMVIDRWGR